MKKIALSALALAISAGSAVAADLPSRKAPILPPPPVLTWTGFYAGLNAGGLWSNNSSINNVAYGLFNDPARTTFGTGNIAALSATGNITGSSNSGFIGGGQIGYNWQIGNVGGLGFGSGFVTGIEADIQGIAGSTGQGNFFGAAVSPVFPVADQFTPVTIARARQNLSYIGTVRGRLGFLAMPTLLIYGTSGLAYGGANLNVAYATADTFGVTPYGGAGSSTSYANTQVGWTAGGGVEWMVVPNWSVKAEYLYYDLGSVQASTVVAGLDQAGTANGYAYTTTASTRFNGNIVRAGVNYHFNWAAAPVVAKY